jgi:hypothetical protein
MRIKTTQEQTFADSFIDMPNSQLGSNRQTVSPY